MRWELVETRQMKSVRYKAGLKNTWVDLYVITHATTTYLMIYRLQIREINNIT